MEQELPLEYLSSRSRVLATQHIISLPNTNLGYKNSPLVSSLYTRISIGGINFNAHLIGVITGTAEAERTPSIIT